MMEARRLVDVCIAWPRRPSRALIALLPWIAFQALNALRTGVALRALLAPCHFGLDGRAVTHQRAARERPVDQPDGPDVVEHARVKHVAAVRDRRVRDPAGDCEQRRRDDRKPQHASSDPSLHRVPPRLQFAVVQHGIDASICCAFAISADASDAAIFLPDCAVVSEMKLSRSRQAAAVLPTLSAACASSSFASKLVCVPFGSPSACTSPINPPIWPSADTGGTNSNKKTSRF